MPKRSNAFQNLLHVIYRQLAGDATVTESKMLIDRATGEEREVDIVIESSLAGHNITVGIECMAKKRRACVEWIERMHGKHKDLPTDRLILVSQSGFYKTALRKAQSHRIETMSLGQAIRRDWTKIAGKTDLMTFEFYDNKATFTLQLKTGDDGIILCGPPNEWTVLLDDGSKGTVSQAVNAIISSDPVRANLFRIMDQGGGPKFLIHYTREKAWSVRDQEGRSQEILGLQIALESIKQSSPLALKHGEVRDYQVAFGEAKFSKGTISFAVLESEGKPGIGAIRWPTGEL